MTCIPTHTQIRQRPQALPVTQEGVNTSLAVAALAGSFTGKQDHISAKAAQQHLHHGAPDTPLYNRKSKRTITLDPSGHRFNCLCAECALTAMLW